MNFSLVIATPFYEMKAYSPYVVSLINSINVLHALNVRFTYYEISGDSYVDRAKNSLIHRFMKEDYSHIFMIDSDEAWTVGAFAKVIKDAMLGAEVVGAAYPLKNSWEHFGVIPIKEDGYFIGKEIPEHGIRLLKMKGIPGGFICYSKKAFERTKPFLKTYKNSGEEVTEYFKCNIEDDGIRIGEDIYFQARYRETGGEVWLEPDASLVHFGVKGWEGNYYEYLLKQKERNEWPL